MKTLDLKNIGCPMVTINLRKALKAMQIGEQITVLCNSKDALNDLRALVNQSRNILVSQSMDSTGKVPVHTLVVEKASP